MIAAIIYLVAITAAELVTIFFPVWGIAFHIIILIAVILHSALGFAGNDLQRRLILSLALVPLVRIISLSMPLVDLPQLLWYPIIYTPLLAAAIVAARILGYSGKQVGLTVKFPLVQIAVGLTGFVFGIAEYLILKPEAMVAELSLQHVWLPALVLLLSTGFVEEFIFRGVLQRTAIKAFRWWGIIYVSSLFAILHVGFLSWLDVVFVFGVALFFGWVVQKTGSLFGVTLAHGVTNIMLFIILPFFL